jgi:HlyD family secretion protein
MWLAGGAVLLAAIIFASVRGGRPRGEIVYTEPVKRRDVQSVVSAPGEIDPRVKVNISAHVIGKIERLYIVEGQNVRKGDRLVDLEKDAFVAQRDRLASEVANRRIEVTRARVALTNAQSQWNRAQSLRGQGIQAEELFDQARLQYDTARASLASAEEGVRQSAAGLRQAETDLTRTTIVAPMSGRIVQLNAHEGEVVITGTMNNPGSVIAVLADLSEILVLAEVGETEVTRVRLAHRAIVEVDAIPDREYSGRVVEIGSSAAVKSGAGGGQRYFKVKIALDQPDPSIRPGMTAQVRIIAEEQKNVIAVPVQSVVERKPEGARAAETEEQPHVLLHQNGKAVLRPVKTGISDDTHITVLSGLKEGDEIITGPFRTLKNLKNGDSVRIEKEQPEGDETKEDDDEEPEQ